MRVLALEPYYGGSHQAFLAGWQRHSRHTWSLFTLPARHWKWRMRHAALWLARQVQSAWQAGQRWDVLLASDMLDLAQFLGLLPSGIARLPSVAYFHENQLTYPTRHDDPRDLHFAWTNFSSAAAADAVWFNSDFHRREFLQAMAAWLRKMPDCRHLAELAAVAEKSSVHAPGIEVLGSPAARPAGPLRIAWAARWEFDKNPETFFRAVRLLKQRGTAFRLIVCGQSFREAPAVFATAQNEFGDQIDHWGYVDSRPDYLRTLAGADVLDSTAEHEFFGLAVLEAIALGLYPVLPSRLSYPELLGLADTPAAVAFFYDGSAAALARRLVELATDRPQLQAPAQRQVISAVAKRYQWSRRAQELDDALQTTEKKGE